MPQTSFTCRDKILGGYYADPETNCQMFHICVKVAGVGVSRNQCCDDVSTGKRKLHVHSFVNASIKKLFLYSVIAIFSSFLTF